MFKKGDRVRYVRGNLHASDKMIGELGTVQGASTVDEHTLVRWDNHSQRTSPWTANLQLVETNMKNIDPSKKLVVTTAHISGTKEATFITETSEGHILVSVKGVQSTWTIFDKQGKFVRSETGYGDTLTLSNVPVEKSVYVRLSATDLQPSVSDKPQSGTAVTVVEVVYKDGVAVDAKLVRANESQSPTRQFRDSLEGRTFTVSQ